MNIALCYKLNITEAYISLKICYSLAELYVTSVHLNLFRVMKFIKHVKGTQTVKVLDALTYTVPVYSVFNNTE
jgi:hypothetical protein